MRRVPSVELLDHDLGSAEEVRENLADLWRINRWLGGVSSNLALLEEFFRRAGRRRATILEVGAGDGRLAAYLRDRLRRRGLDVEYVVLDRRLSHLNLGEPAQPLRNRLVADALELPFAPDSFDAVTCNLLFHHFSEESAVDFLRDMFRVARQAVLMSDLERHPLPYLFIRTTPWFIRNRMSRHDGLASVRQAYTQPELGELLRQAGFANFAVRRRAPFRLGVAIWKKPVNDKRERGPSLDADRGKPEDP